MATSSHARLLMTAVIVGVCCVLLGVVSVTLLIAQTNAVDALRTSSSRAECRTRIVNEAEDVYRHDVAEQFALTAEATAAFRLEDYRAVDLAVGKAEEVARRMSARPRVQGKIDAECPAALVQTNGASP
jgi:hypothetical protein